MFFKVTNTPLKRVFKRLVAFYAALLIRELENWRIGEFNYNFYNFKSFCFLINSVLLTKF